MILDGAGAPPIRGLVGADEMRLLPADELAAAVVDDTNTCGTPAPDAGAGECRWLGLAGATPLGRQGAEGDLHGQDGVLGTGGEQELAVWIG